VLLRFESAQRNELPIILDLLDEAAVWLRARDILQWPPRFSDVDDWRAARIASYVEDGQAWLVRISSEVVATFTIGAADPDYADGWPDGPDDALYIFRMAVRRAWAGRNLGGRILDWASARALARGHKWLRLDCHRDNTALQNYYEARGFIRVGTLIRTITDGPQPGSGQPYTRGSGALYQRPAGSIHLPPRTAHPRGDTAMPDRYDITGEAAIWQEASELVAGLKLHEPPIDQLSWNTALEQAARTLENRAREIRQRNGMYFRVLGEPETNGASAD